MTFHRTFHPTCQGTPIPTPKGSPCPTRPTRTTPAWPSSPCRLCRHRWRWGGRCARSFQHPPGQRRFVQGQWCGRASHPCPGEQEPPAVCGSWGRGEGTATRGREVTLQLCLPCEPSAAFPHLLLTCTIPSSLSQTSDPPATKKKYFIRNKAARRVRPTRSHSTPVALQMLYLLSIHHSHPGRKQWPTAAGAVRFSLSSLKAAPRGTKTLAEGLPSQPSI